MKIYSPQKLRPLMWLSMLLRGLIYLLRHWLLLLIAALVILPVGPYLIVWYSYTDYGTHRIMNECTYLGGGGLVERHNRTTCPVIVMIDRRTE